jgi:hypothetical protein
MALHGIHIKPGHRGKFTAKGISVEKGLHSKDETTRKEANFARMAKRHFKPLAKKSDSAGKLYKGKTSKFKRNGKEVEE